jgi:TP901 family phage tail tape measure protein
MARVKAVSNANIADFKAMQEEAKKLGETTRYTASEAASALESLTRNGMTAQQATKALSGVLQLAQANAIGLSEAADIVSNSLNMFGLSVENTARVNDVLSATAGNSATNISELYDALVNAAPAANVLGFSIEETAAAIGALAQKGVKGADAGTQLRMSLTKMADPKIIKKMQDMGVAIDSETMKSEGLLKTVEKLKDAHLDLTDLVGIFSQKGAMGMQQLISAYDDFNYMLGITQNAAGTTQRMFEDGVGSVRKEIDSLKSAYEGLLISIGEKTSGIVKGTIKLLQNLINNFKSIGGTIANFASVLVPLLTKKLVALGKTAKTTFQAIKTGAMTAQAAMGGWITIIATLVTWIGTALVGAWNKAHQAMKDATRNMSNVAVESEKLSRNAGKLIESLGPDTNASTLAGVIKKLTEMMPDFADAIRDAGRVAAQTGDWNKLKSTLQDIVDLQNLIKTRDAKQELANAQQEQFGQLLFNAGKHPALAQKRAGDKPQAAIIAPSKHIYDQLAAQGLADEAIQKIYNEIADALSKSNPRIDLNKILGDYNVDISADEITKLIAGSMGLASRDALEKANRNLHQADSTANAKAIDVARQAFKDSENLNKKNADVMHDAAQTFYDAVVNYGGTEADFKEARDYLNKYPRPTYGGSGGGSGSGSGKEAQTPADKLTNIITGYTESVKSLKSQYENGAISFEAYQDELDKLEDETWKAITAFSDFKEILSTLSSELQTESGNIKRKAIGNQFSDSVETSVAQKQELGKYGVPTAGARDKTFDYMLSDREKQEVELKIKLDYVDTVEQLAEDLQKAINDGDFNIVKANAEQQLQTLLNTVKQAKTEATDMQHALNLAEIEDQIKEIDKELKETTFTNITTIAQAFDRLTDSMFSIAEVFNEDLKDSEFYKGFEKVLTVINATIQAIETWKAVIQALQVVQDLQAKIAEKNALKQAAANAIVTASEEAKATASAGAAVAGAASSVASIPLVGWVLAGAAVATIAGILLSSMSKFANGGIIAGNSTHGDHNVVRANSGEMILTKGQQATLFDAIQSGNLGGGGNVQFKIRGTDLIGVMNNTQQRINGSR